MGIGFQSVDATSPDIVPSLLRNDSCAGISTCTGCIAAEACGYCFSASNWNGNGTCLPYTTPKDSLIGACASGGVNGHIWATNFCPSPRTWIILLGLICYILVFGPGMGAMPWTINTEIYPQWARGVGGAFATGVNSIFNLITSFTFLSLTQALGTPGAFFLYCSITLTMTVLLYCFLPETRGRSLEEVSVLFEDLIQVPWLRKSIKNKNAPTPAKNEAFDSAE